MTITDSTGEPADVGFDGRNRVYILNLNNVSGPPTVQFYNSTNGKQLGTLSDPSLNDLFGIGTDQLGNVFVSNLTTANIGTVVEFPHGKMPGSQLSGVGLGLPGAPTFDSNNNLIITIGSAKQSTCSRRRIPGRQPLRRLWDRRSGASSITSKSISIAAMPI